jgi:hypothetical protein
MSTLTTESLFEAQSDGLHTRCLRFAAKVTPGPRKTRIRWSTSNFRMGLVTHGFQMKAFILLELLGLPSDATVELHPSIPGKESHADAKLSAAGFSS